MKNWMGSFFPFHISGASSYTILYNLVNFPAGVVPVSTVTQEDENELKHYKGNFGDILDKTFKKVSLCVPTSWD